MDQFAALRWVQREHRWPTAYWISFAHSADPNGPRLSLWPKYSAEIGFPVMHLTSQPRAEIEQIRECYLFLGRKAVQR